MLKFAELVKDVHPGLFVHSIYIEENLDSDQRAGFVSFTGLFFPGDSLESYNLVRSLET